jgi:hypothetical protein
MRSQECQSSPRAEVSRGEEMRTKDDVAAMLQLKGWGVKRIARELRCSAFTVRRYQAEGGCRTYRRPARRCTLSWILNGRRLGL